MVTVDPVPVVNLGPDTSLCVGETWVMDAGNPGSTYLWNTMAVTQTLNTTVDGTFSVDVTNVFGCTVQDSIAVTFDPLPVINIVDMAVCISETVVLDAGNMGSQYMWSTLENTQSVLVDSVSGVYSVVVTTPTFCTDSASANLTFVDFPIVDLGSDTALCDTETLTLDAGNPGSAFLWSDGSTSQTAQFTASESVWVMVDNGFCITFDSIEVVFNPLPDDALEDLIVTCFDLPNSQVVLDAENTGSTYFWSTTDTTQSITIQDYDNYTVAITTPFNCTTTDQVDVVEYCPSAIYVPNAFSPDGDGVNDHFTVAGNNLAFVQLRIFNRWGELLYDGIDGEAIWDGAYSGEFVADGVYIWQLEFRYLEDFFGTVGVTNTLMGHVTVIR